MRFLGHVPNSLRNKNMEKHIPYLFFKWFFWPSKLHYSLRAQEKKALNFFVNFEHYDLANDEE
jgi:hypothetical protein